MAKLKPNIERGEKFLFNSLLWPRAANCAYNPELADKVERVVGVDHV
jgi:hypothetical protein